MAFRVITDEQGRLGRFFCEVNKIDYQKDTRSVYIGLESNGVLNAVAEYNNFQKGSIQIHQAITGRINLDVLRLVFHYPFVLLGVKKIIGKIPSNNEKSLKLSYHLGFVHECTIKDAGDNCDLVILSMTKAQCRFLS